MDTNGVSRPLTRSEMVQEVPRQPPEDPLALDPLSPLPFSDPRWFIPAHGPEGSRTVAPAPG
jgi:hypothetical protein